MRLLAATAIATAAFVATGCSSSDDDSPKAVDTPSSASSPSATEKSVRKDVEAYAVQLEQVFAGSTYPKTTAAAVGIAKELDLTLSPGNTIASYVYDPDKVEFKLCVQNTSGAWAVYDTRPMTVLKSGASGGCP
jgi:hypothetical protein